MVVITKDKRHYERAKVVSSVLAQGRGFAIPEACCRRLRFSVDAFVEAIGRSTQINNRQRTCRCCHDARQVRPPGKVPLLLVQVIVNAAIRRLIKRIHRARDNACGNILS